MFAAAEETELQRVKLLAKERKKLTESTLIKFNGGYINQEGDLIQLCQERQCQNLWLINQHKSHLLDQLKGRNTQGSDT